MYQIFGLAGTQMEKAAKDLDIPFWAEFYGDVKYSKDGMLVIDKKKKPWDLEDVKKHVSQQLNTQSVTAVSWRASATTGQRVSNLDMLSFG